MKAKKARLNSNKVEPTIVKELSQYLEESQSDQEIMDLYEETEARQEKDVNSYDINVDDKDLSDSQLEEIKVCCQASQEDETAQCVPEISTPPSSVIKTDTSNGKRPKFKVTPKRKRMVHMTQGNKKIKLSQLDSSEDETIQCKPNKTKKNKEGSWVQCSKPECMKWRKLPNDVEPVTVPERWVCPMNSDESHMDCAASQETCDSEMDYDVIYTPYVAGSIVWAKVPGYPWWPGMVDDDPDYNCCYETDDSNVTAISYHVSFIFDKDVSRSWVSYLSIRSFIGSEDPNETSFKSKKPPKPLLKAKTLARKAMELPLKERVKKYSFCVLYKGPIGKIDKKSKKRKQKDRRDSSPESRTSLEHKKREKVKIKKQVHFEKLKGDGKTPTSAKIGPENDENKAVVKRKKKTKRILLSSDEDEVQDVHETDLNKQTNGSIDEKSGESKSGKDVSQMKLSDDTNKEVDMAHSKKSNEEKKKRSSEISTDNQDESKIKGRTGEKKKQKGKTDKEENNDINKSVKLSQQTEQNNELRNHESKKAMKQKKSGKNENNEGIKKKVSKDGLKFNKIATSNEKPVKNGNKRDNSESLLENLPGKSKKMLIKAGKETGNETKDSVSNDKARKTSADEKKTKKLKKSSFAIPSLTKTKKSKSVEAVENIDSKAKKISEIVKMDKGGSHQKTKNNVVPSNKKMKPTFGKFTAPVKSNTGKVITKTLATNDQLSGVTHKSTMSACTTQKNTTSPRKTDTISSNTTQSHSMLSSTIHRVTLLPDSHGNDKRPDDPPEDLDSYVNIGTLEKDINSLYQQLSEGDVTTGGFLEYDGVRERQQDCVTVEFLDEELTTNAGIPRNSPKCLAAPDSPEF